MHNVRTLEQNRTEQNRTEQNRTLETETKQKQKLEGGRKRRDIPSRLSHALLQRCQTWSPHNARAWHPCLGSNVICEGMIAL